MNNFKKIIACIMSVSILSSISLIPIQTNAMLDNDVIQEEFNEIQSSNPDYLEFKHVNMEDGTTDTILVDDSLNGLETAIQAKQDLNNFISTCSIITGSTVLEMNVVNNCVGWVTVNNGNVSGTGFLIAPDLVLTAAHCVNGLSNIGFEAGHNKGAYKCKSTVSDVFIPSKYGTTNNYDFAILKLSSSVDSSIGYVDIGIPTTALEGKPITVIGYPQVSGNTNCEKQMYSTGTLVSICDSTYEGIQHTASTAGGMSGSPIYIQDGSAIGVHTSGGGNYNYGTRITGAIYRFVMLDYDSAIKLP